MIKENKRTVALVFLLIITSLCLFLVNKFIKNDKDNNTMVTKKQNLDSLVRQANSRSAEERQIALSELTVSGNLQSLIENVRDDNSLADMSAIALARIGQREAIPIIKSALAKRKSIRFLISLIILNVDIDENKTILLTIFEGVLNKENSSTMDELIAGLDYLRDQVITKQDAGALKTIMKGCLKGDAAYSEEFNMALSSVSLVNQEIFIKVLVDQNKEVQKRVIHGLPIGLDYGFPESTEKKQWLNKWKPYSTNLQGEKRKLSEEMISAVENRLKSVNNK